MLMMRKIKRKFQAVLLGFLFCFLFFSTYARVVKVLFTKTELYAAAGSMSGVMNINTKTWNVPEDFAKSRAANFARLLGPPKDTWNP